VVERGVGDVERNTAASILTFKQVKNSLQEKTTMMRTVVVKKRDSKRRTIVLEGTQAIVGNDGRVLNSHHIYL
jgi:hypothetical protein